MTSFPPLHPRAQWPAPPQDPDLELATRCAPCIPFDRREPFFPQAAGHTVFRADGDSSSFPRHLMLRPVDWPPAALAIECAI